MRMEVLCRVTLSKSFGSIAMREERMRQSSNVEDRRGDSPGGGFATGGGGRLVAGGGLGAVILVVIVVLLGGNPMQLLQQMGAGGPGGGGGGGGSLTLPGGAGAHSGRSIDPSQQHAADFVSRVLGDTEDVWTQLFQQQGLAYEEPALVLFSGEVESACGYASAASGPFYCPADSKLYIDLDFYNELSTKYGAPGDFAQAYVIAHEVGHHVQNLLGASSKVHQLQQRVSKEEGNDLSVRLELQADYYAGVWAHFAEQRQILEAGDLEEGLRAASAVGDDRLQLQARGYVVPESFTHGSSEQRARWFRKGFQSGDMAGGDTFRAGPL